MVGALGHCQRVRQAGGVEKVGVGGQAGLLSSLVCSATPNWQQH